VPSPRTTAVPLVTASLLALPTVLAFSAGGFFEGARLRAGVAVWVAVALAAALGRDLVPRSRAARVCLAGLLGLAVWTTVAVAWSPLRDPALADASTVWLYAGFLVLATALLRGATARVAEPAVALGALVVTGYAVATRLLPGLVPSARSFRAGARLDQPLTYWNALGLVAAIAIVLLLRMASDESRDGRLRTVAAGLVPLPGLALYLTFSRGSIAALAAGIVVLLLLCRERRVVATTLVCLGCVGLLAGATTRFHAIDSLSGGRSTQETQGLAVLAILLVACVLSALGARAVARGAAERVGGVAAAAAAVLAIALAGGAALAITRSPAPPPSGPLSRSGDAQLPTTRGRLTTLKSNRYAYWRVAARAFAGDPLAGIGTHGFQAYWLKHRDRDENAQDAHSLYVETAAELGLIGLALLATFLGGAGAAGARLLRAPAGRALGGGWIAASATYLVHAGVDWDWEMPAATLPFLLLAGALLAAAGEADAAAQPRGGTKRGLSSRARA
jgi:hypothetical protein